MKLDIGYTSAAAIGAHIVYNLSTGLNAVSGIGTGAVIGVAAKFTAEKIGTFICDYAISKEMLWIRVSDEIYSLKTAIHLTSHVLTTAVCFALAAKTGLIASAVFNPCAVVSCGIALYAIPKVVVWFLKMGLALIAPAPKASKQHMESPLAFQKPQIPAPLTFLSELPNALD